MSDAAVPDARCERCGSRGVMVEWDDDDRKYTRVCQLCGYRKGAAIATKPREAPKEEAKVTDNGTEAKPKTDWRSKEPVKATVATKPDSAAAKALESYHVATTRYLEATQKLDDAEQRRADADARVASCLDAVTSSQSQMREARAKLDSELALLTPAGEPKPFRERVKVAEGSGRAKRHELTCEVCGVSFQAAMPTTKYCSAGCRNRRATEIRLQNDATAAALGLDDSPEPEAVTA